MSECDEYPMPSVFALSSWFNGMVWADLSNQGWGWTRLGTFRDEPAMLWPQLALVKPAAALTSFKGSVARTELTLKEDWEKNLLETIGILRPTDMFSSLCFAWCHSFGESWFFQAFEIWSQWPYDFKDLWGTPTGTQGLMTRISLV